MSLRGQGVISDRGRYALREYVGGLCPALKLHCGSADEQQQITQYITLASKAMHYSPLTYLPGHKGFQIQAIWCQNYGSNKELRRKIQWCLPQEVKQK